MINRLSNLINRNRSAAKISQVLCSTAHPPLQHHEGEEGEQGDPVLQQAGSPGFLHHLER